MTSTTTRERNVITVSFDWQGVTLSVDYEPDYLGMSSRHGSLASAHLSIHSVAPERAPLPFTETGYRSHFLHAHEVDDMGGPAAYVLAWLEQAAKSKEWLEMVAKSRQYTLF